MTSPWYLRVATRAAGVHLFPIPDVCTPEGIEEREQLLARARQVYAIPDEWMSPDLDDQRIALGWDMYVTSGPLHPKLTSRPDVTVHNEAP
jgi:hypothetical protein